MKRFAVSAAACLLLSTATVGLAQTYEVSSIAPNNVFPEQETSAQASREADPSYIVDVTGKRVRMIGPRFYPDNTKGVELMGRRQALQKEAGRMEASLPKSTQ